MSNGIYTFYPEFSQYVTLYRGVTAVWIGNGNSSSPSNPDFPSFNDQGVLYASYIDDSVQNLGPVSSFAEAVASGKAGPGTDFPTEADWILHIAATSQHAQDALVGAENSLQSAGDSESWAAGTRDGEADTERQGASTNNSKYWAEQAASSAYDADLSAVAADGSADDAADSAAEAKEWAVWNAVGEASASNNSKTYSEVSGEQRRQSESWAVGTRDGLDDDQRQGATTNNSKYWCQQSQAWATTKSQDNAKYYSEVAGTHATNAATSEDNAKKWAAWNAVAEPDASNNAKSYCDTASEKASDAEAWANGTRNNSSIQSGDAAYNKFSRYWASLASESATSASGFAGNASDSALEAHNWANGGLSGTPSATNNARYYAGLAEDSANSVQNPEIVVTYQSSSSGSTIPTGDWSSSRTPVKGEFLWIRITFNWSVGSPSNFYMVSYQGLDGSGSVTSVNGETRNVVLDSSNIYMDYYATVENRRTIAEAIVGKIDSADYISDAQIDSLFEE